MSCAPLRKKCPRELLDPKWLYTDILGLVHYHSVTQSLMTYSKHKYKIIIKLRNIISKQLFKMTR